jgi:hypothetical protein
MTGNAMEIIAYLSGIRDESKKNRIYDLTEHKEKRSLDANGMLWACISDIAKALHTDKWEVYLLMLKRYGKYSYVLVDPKAVESMKSQWREIEEVGEVDVNGRKAVQLLCYYGSSTYNTKEFSDLLNGVISEMDEMGLKLPPDKETKALLEQWGKKNG